MGRAEPVDPSPQGHDPRCPRHLGGVTINDYALPRPSSRAEAHVRIVARRRDLDLHCHPRCSTTIPLFPRMIYARVLCAPIRANELVGARSRRRPPRSHLDGPRFISVERLHARALSVPVRALLRSVHRADHAERRSGRDRRQCMAGSGSCASVSPTAQHSYRTDADAPDAAYRTLLQRPMRKASRSSALCCSRRRRAKLEIVDALARFGEGLPPMCFRLRVDEVTQLGPRCWQRRSPIEQQRRDRDSAPTAPRHHCAARTVEHAALFSASASARASSRSSTQTIQDQLRHARRHASRHHHAKPPALFHAAPKYAACSSCASPPRRSAPMDAVPLAPARRSAA